MRFIPTLLLALAALLLAFPAAAQDCPGTVLTTQEEVDAFSCSTIPFLIVGSLDDGDDPASIQNLDGLSELTAVASSFSIQSTSALESLAGLENLSSVGLLVIRNNAQLTDISALSNLTSASRLAIFENDALSNVEGLAGLTETPSGLSLESNPSLTSLNGLRNLTAVGGLGLTLDDNDALVSFDGLGALASVTGPVSIGQNAVLENVDALQGVTSFSGNVFIRNNEALQSLGGFSNLATIGGVLTLDDNDALQTLDGLGSLTAVGARIAVTNNGALENVDAFSSLASIGATLGTSLQFEQNPVLARCAPGLRPILTADQADPGTIEGEVILENNAPGGDCNSVADILADEPPSALPLTDVSLTPGTCPAVLPAGRASCRVLASATLTAERGQRFTVFLRLDGPEGFSRIAFRGEIKPGAGGSASQSIKLQTKKSDPAGAYTVTLVVAPGSVPAPTAAAEDLASFETDKALPSLGLRAAQPLTAYPNPATHTATLAFATPEAAKATLVLYDALGREVARPVDGPVSGFVNAHLDASALPAGLYVARLTTADRAETVRFSVVR